MSESSGIIGRSLSASVFRGPFRINGLIYSNNYVAKRIRYTRRTKKRIQRHIDKEIKITEILNKDTPITHQNSLDNNIICVRSVYVSDNMFITIQPYGGITLSKCISDRLLTMDKYIQGFNQLLRAIKFLVSHGIVHLDVRDDNITVKIDTDGKAIFYLIDFDISLTKDDFNVNNKRLYSLADDLTGIRYYPHGCHTVNGLIQLWDKIDLYCLCSMFDNYRYRIKVDANSHLCDQFFSLVGDSRVNISSIDEAIQKFNHLV